MSVVTDGHFTVYSRKQPSQLTSPVSTFNGLNTRPSHLPPGPKPWPIIGNIFHLKNNPHRSLAALSKIHGPLVTLNLGSIIAVVVSSVDVAKEKRLSSITASSSLEEEDVLATLLKINKEDGSDLSIEDIKHLILKFESVLFCIS
ncbi:hypothetical protein V2J09_015210 [Rumex salicifolius]